VALKALCEKIIRAPAKLFRSPLAKAGQGQVWRQRNYFELLVGQSLCDTVLVLTDGGNGSSPFGADDYGGLK